MPPSKIRSPSAQATSITKTKPRRSTVRRPRAINTLNPDRWGDIDEEDPNLATAQDEVVATGAARDPTTSHGAQSLSNLRGAIDREDASTQCEDEDIKLLAQARIRPKNSPCQQKFQFKASLPQ